MSDLKTFPAGILSLRWYREIANDPEYASAAFNSITLAFEAAAVALVLGVTAALATVRYSYPSRAIVRVLSTSPLFVPMVMTGLAVLVFATDIGLFNQNPRLLMDHIALTVPYVVRSTENLIELPE